MPSSLEQVGGAHGAILRDFLATGHNDDGSISGGSGLTPSGGDDSASIQGRAPDVRLGAGSYSAPSGLSFASKAAVSGIGAASRDYSSAADALSEILCTSPTADGVNFAANPARIEKTGIRSTAASPSAGAGLACPSSSGFTARDLHIRGFYDGIRHAGVYYDLDNIIVSNPARYGIYLNGGFGGVDYGDGNIRGCTLLCGPVNQGSSALRWEGGGGMKVRDLKVNAGGKYWVNGIDVVSQPSTSTGELSFGDCVIDNYTGKGVNLDCTAASSAVSGIVFDNCLVKSSANPTNGYVIRGTCPRISIVGGGVYMGSNALSAFDIDNVVHVTIDGVVIAGVPQTNPMIKVGGTVTSFNCKLGNLCPPGATAAVVWPTGSTWLFSAAVGPHQLARAGTNAQLDFAWTLPTVNSTSTWANLWEIAGMNYGPVSMELMIVVRQTGQTPDEIAYYGRRISTYNSSALTLTTVGTDVLTHPTDIEVQWVTAGAVCTPQMRLKAGTGLTTCGLFSYSIMKIVGWPNSVKAYA